MSLTLACSRIAYTAAVYAVSDIAYTAAVSLTLAYILLTEIRELIGISHVFYCVVAAVTGI